MLKIEELRQCVDLPDVTVHSTGIIEMREVKINDLCEGLGMKAKDLLNVGYYSQIDCYIMGPEGMEGGHGVAKLSVSETKYHKTELLNKICNNFIIRED